MNSRETIGLVMITGDPPTLGHQRLAKLAKESGRYKQVRVVPVFDHPTKSVETLFDDRFFMTILTIADLGTGGGIIATDIEKYLARPSYSYQTIERVAQDTGCAIEIIMGSDAWNDYHNWEYVEQINAGILIVPRNGVQIEQPLPLGVSMLNVEPINGCSGDARQARSYQELLTTVSPSVALYIMTKGLYQFKNE